MQGAIRLYVSYLHPGFLAHESEIEEFATFAHENFKCMGKTLVKNCWDFLCLLLFGERRPETSTEPSQVTSSSPTFLQTIISRIKITPPIGGGFSTSIDRFIPKNLKSQAETKRYFEAERAKLSEMLSALEKAEELELLKHSHANFSQESTSGDAGMEYEFENISRDVTDNMAPLGNMQGYSSWWFWRSS